MASPARPHPGRPRRARPPARGSRQSGRGLQPGPRGLDPGAVRRTAGRRASSQTAGSSRGRRPSRSPRARRWVGAGAGSVMTPMLAVAPGGRSGLSGGSGPRRRRGSARAPVRSRAHTRRRERVPDVLVRLATPRTRSRRWCRPRARAGRPSRRARPRRAARGCRASRVPRRRCRGPWRGYAPETAAGSTTSGPPSAKPSAAPSVPRPGSPLAKRSAGPSTSGAWRTATSSCGIEQDDVRVRDVVADRHADRGSRPRRRARWSRGTRAPR